MLGLFFTYIDEKENKRTFEAVYYAYRKQMLLVALGVVQSTSDAEDIVQEVFLKIVTRHMPTIERIADATDLRNYLLRATKNTALDWQKKNKRAVAVEKEILSAIPDMKHEELEKYLCEKMEYEQVVEAIKGLEPKYREVLYYHYVMEMPASQIAELCNQSLESTKKQLVRGKKKLLQKLKGGQEDANDQGRT